MSTLKHFQAEIAFRMRRGDAFATIEDEVINPSALGEDEKAALWLYGWSFVDWRLQRREALAHIEILVGEQHAETPILARVRRPDPMTTSTVATRAPGPVTATVARRQGLSIRARLD